MKCKSVALRLDDFVDGRLTLEEETPLRRHLARCPSCARELEALTMLRQSLKRTEVPLPDADYEDRLVGAVMARLNQRERHEIRMWWAAAAATTIFACMALMLVSWRKQELAEAAELDRGAFELSRDQAYVHGADPLSNNTLVMPAGYRQ